MRLLLVGEGPSELGGALETLIRRLGLSDAEVEQAKVSQAGLHSHHGKGRGYFKRAVRWMLEAGKQGYDGIVLVIDEDGNSARVKEIAQAQEFEGASIRRALGVAIRSFDAWMLADEKTLTSVLDFPVPRQPDPEKITDPKAVCSELLDHSDCDLTPSGMYREVMVVVDIDILETRCKKGFAPFADRVRKM